MQNRTLFVKTLSLILASVFLFACAPAVQKNPIIIHTAVKDIDEFGDAHLADENTLLEYGDSVNIDFSGGVSLKDIPFYPDFFGRSGDYLLADNNAHYVVGGISCSFFSRNPFEIGETVTISLSERGKYAEEYAAYNVPLGRTKWEGQSDEAFLNARMVRTGSVQEGILYRGPTPFDPKYNRVELMDQYIQDHNIQCIISLSSAESSLTDTTALPEHTRQMIENGQVIPSLIGIEYSLPATKETLGSSFRKMMTMPGPYLIHCSFGRDRTGVVCALLEGLCGADYDEIRDDFMESFYLLNNVSRDPSTKQNQLFGYNFTDSLCEMFELSENELKTADFRQCARDYLRSCGLSDTEIDTLAGLLTGDKG